MQTLQQRQRCAGNDNEDENKLLERENDIYIKMYEH